MNAATPILGVSSFPIIFYNESGLSRDLPNNSSIRNGRSQEAA